MDLFIYRYQYGAGYLATCLYHTKTQNHLVLDIDDDITEGQDEINDSEQLINFIRSNKIKIPALEWGILKTLITKSYALEDITEEYRFRMDTLTTLDHLINHYIHQRDHTKFFNEEDAQLLHELIAMKNDLHKKYPPVKYQYVHYIGMWSYMTILIVNKEDPNDFTLLTHSLNPSRVWKE